MATIQLGKIKQVWRGTWTASPNPAYSVDDLVAYTDTVGGLQNTSTYIAVSTPGSNAPASGGSVHASWNLVAQGVPDRLPTQNSGTNGKALISDGTNVSWGSGGAWTKIAGGEGPSTAVAGITIDNIFSDTYKYYKIYYSFAAAKVIYFRYVKADGTTQSGTNYQNLIHGANHTSSVSNEHDMWGYGSQDKGLYHWWDSADDKPAYCEINLYHPYASSRCTLDFHQAVWYYGNKLGCQIGSNIYLNAESHRGIYMYNGGSGDHIDTDFKYLVLGAN